MPHAHTLYSVGAIRRMEQAALRTLPAFTLMQRAAAAATDCALELLQDAGASPEILVLVGPGNNGGDALETAHLLALAHYKISILMTAPAENFSADARQAWQHARDSSARWLSMANIDELAGKKWALVIDGLFGIGLARAISGDTAHLIHVVNAMRTRVLALDIPSGLDADTGIVIGGPEGCAIEASHTITFIGNKPGLHTGDGRDHAGKVRVADLGIDTELFHATRMECTEVGSFADMLQPRRHNSHKGSYGDVVVVGGSPGMIGAAILCARAAAKLGAGRVFIASLTDGFALDPQQPEIMCRPLQEMAFEGKTLVVGPGLSTTRSAHDALARALASDAPLVLDADALNLMALEPGLQKKLRGRQRPVILTPHPLEAARLLASDTMQVQTDRIAAARTLASRLQAVIVLKGSGSVAASPDGSIAINPTGNPALATAGAGDVLAGVCGALLAQAWPAWQAALAATWLHGSAADQLVSRGIGPIGLTAGELISEIRATLNRLVAVHASR